MAGYIFTGLSVITNATCVAAGEVRLESINEHGSGFSSEIQGFHSRYDLRPEEGTH